MNDFLNFEVAKPYLNKIWLFITRIPSIIKETFVWLFFSYLIPLINIGIIWGIKEKESEFAFTLSIISIIIVTNACLYTSLYFMTFSQSKKRKLLTMVNICAFVISIVTFSLVIVEIEKEMQIFSLALYRKIALITLIIAVLLGLISKYDEEEAISQQSAEKASKINKATIGDKDLKV
ncbi:hypothetical protein E0W68_06690 [Flavobacterium salilacus subsp. salilacus]|uniref:hypothetical protein n=1 Tax=Flavobacterium TaxID=237 RepID=UPI001075528C|nr:MULTISPECIES: hypothetical protein [Flavobacterium]KAF2518938.1 hypothetical protein E0W68_06690 [Flavobacterium salilacus subsp. salilacus]MBE1614900.1 hypothetical protein [Flavobacterium sp. SaA2.13]